MTGILDRNAADYALRLAERYFAGTITVTLLNALLKAAADPKPARAATSAMLSAPFASSRAAVCIRQLVRYCIGEWPISWVKRSPSAERDSPTFIASSSTVHCREGSP